MTKEYRNPNDENAGRTSTLRSTFELRITFVIRHATTGSRSQGRWGSFHEPERRPPARPVLGAYYPRCRAGGRRSAPPRFMVPMHGIKVVGAFHEPARPSTCTFHWESGAEAARTPDASRLPGVSEPREASGVRPIYRRFPYGAGRSHGSRSQCMRRNEWELSIKLWEKSGTCPVRKTS